MRDIDERLGALCDSMTLPSVDIAAMANQLGVAASAANWPVDEVFKQLARVGVLQRSDAVDVLASTTRGLISHTESVFMNISCEDPLTRLAHPAHLHQRLLGLQRLALRDDRPIDHELLAVDFAPGPSALHDDLAALDCAEVLRSVFTGDEVFTRLHAQRVGVLVHRGDRDSLSVALVQRLVQRTPSIRHPTVSVATPPDTAHDLPVWLAFHTRHTVG